MDRIKELKLEIEGYSQEIKDIKENIASLKDDISSIKYRRNIAKDDIAEILKKREDKEEKKKRIEGLKFSGDTYDDSLKKASIFCSLDREDLSSIKVYKDKIASANGYIGVIIETPVPKEDWNKNISWDLDERSVLTGSVLELLEDVYRAGQANIGERRFVKKRDIVSTLKPEKRKIENGDTVYIFSYDDMQVAIDIEHFNNALAIFKDDDELFLKFPNSRIGAVFIESSNIKTIVMPIRLS